MQAVELSVHFVAAHLTEFKPIASFSYFSGVAAPNLHDTAIDYWLYQYTRPKYLVISLIKDRSYADDDIILAELAYITIHALRIMNTEAMLLGFNWEKTIQQSARYSPNYLQLNEY